MDRQHTKVPGELLDHARAGVEYRRTHGEPDLTLLDWIAHAVAAQLAADAARFPGYPTLDALAQRYDSDQQQSAPSHAQPNERTRSQTGSSTLGGHRRIPR